MPRILLVACLALLCTPLASCKSRPKMDLPLYPGSTQSGPSPNVETDAGILFKTRRQTPDRVGSVAAFYAKELVQGRGWSEVAGVGSAFADGNLNVTRSGGMVVEALPIDATRRGGFVQTYEVQNVTYIETFQFVPASGK
jgi:hypothetical protein